MIFLSPVKTEKSLAMGKNNSFVFKINTGVNKNQLRKEIEEMFGVDVVRVRTISTVGKVRHYKRIKYHKPDTKKAIVTLKENQTIPLFETDKKGKKRKGGADK